VRPTFSTRPMLSLRCQAAFALIVVVLSVRVDAQNAALFHAAERGDVEAIERLVASVLEPLGAPAARDPMVPKEEPAQPAPRACPASRL
jgi:hypothetical protein